MRLLTKRQEEILRAVVRQYTTTGQPVGSKGLVDQLPMKVSSATVRNEMATLEKDGYLLKQHSSSGRIPSKLGYRYYVDNLLDQHEETSNDLSVIQQSLGAEFHKIDEIISQSADILSKLTSYTTFTIRTDQREQHLGGFRMVPLGNHQVMGILVTDSGDVENQVFTIPAEINPETLEKVIRLINDQLKGLPLVEVMHRLQTDIPLKMARYLNQPEGFLDLFDQVLNQAARERFFVGGRTNLLGFTQEATPQQMQAIYQLMDADDQMAAILDQPNQNSHDIQVRIGQEIAGDQILDHYSLITAKYNVEGYGQGLIAVLGPTRMSYSRTIGLVDAFRRELAKRLLDQYHHYHDS